MNGMCLVMMPSFNRIRGHVLDIGKESHQMVFDGIARSLTPGVYSQLAVD
jgi:hypothetical protein